MYWLFFYDDIGCALQVIECGDIEKIRHAIDEFTKPYKYIRQWISEGMTWIDFGSHFRFLKVYPAVNILSEKGGET